MEESRVQVLDRMLEKLGEHADAVVQFLEVLGKLHRTGLLAVVDGVLEEFDEVFNAATRPELMTMVANLMMLLGAVGQVRYEPFFRAAMHAPQAVNEKLDTLVGRSRPLRLMEAWDLLRSPEVAAALEVLVTALRAMRPPVQEGGR
ncbi:MAG: hypothetical protein QN193_10835 [Armatimonadota bacterium]|nr:hypothetical protein [Armatimonadota bacterium]MDR7445202.1 hypothetical protein [Armatimonadota bacterium]MDR7571089.1 hypothetical protein [Armatimonadota bacterium]MDR7613697.1 hypothetical protein [Armatimonadota bacterium]